MELICPAGSLPALKAAVDHGADAVYLGFSDATNARNFAGLNFSPEEIARGIQHAHAAGARVFEATLVVFHAARFELPPYFTSAQADALKRQHRDQQKQAKDFLRLRTRKLLGKEAGRIRLQFETADAHPIDR